MEHLNLTHQQQIEAFFNNQTLSLIQSQLQAIKRAMSDCNVSGEDFLQEGILVVLKKLKTWNPSKGSLTTHCWLDLRSKFNRLKHRQTQQYFLSNSLKFSPFYSDSEEHRLILASFLESLTPLEKQIVALRWSKNSNYALICSELKISLQKLKNHVKIIKHKLTLAGFHP